MNWDLEGCYLIDLPNSQDNRGSFIKIFQQSFLKNKTFQVKESFFSLTHKSGLRGLHFQVPPKSHDKIVSCISGSAFDVVFDMRKNSKSYGKVATFSLQSKTPQGVYIPAGCAHGFQALEDNTGMFYITDCEYDPERDKGIRWDSVGVSWPLETKLISARDNAFSKWENYESPF